jgi:transcriptional regulator of acetoin/glycerol metabolism
MQTGEVSPEDLELMASLSSHVAVALEIALTRDRAELYQRELAREHDRLRVLLEVNNHVVTKLDTIELFRAASASIRSYFHNDFTGFWLIGKDSSQLELAVLDFPGSRGFLADDAVHELSSSDREKLRAHNALKAASGQISGYGGAAERLGLKRTTLQNKMRRLNICRADYAY